MTEVMFIDHSVCVFIFGMLGQLIEIASCHSFQQFLNCISLTVILEPEYQNLEAGCTLAVVSEYIR